MAGLAEEVVQQGGNGGFSVRSRNADDFQFPRGMAEKRVRRKAKGECGIHDLDIADIGVRMNGDAFAYHGDRPGLKCRVDVGMAIREGSRQGKKGGSFCCAPGIEAEEFNDGIRGTGPPYCFNLLQYVIQSFQTQMKLMVNIIFCPLWMRVPGGSDCSTTFPRPRTITFNPAFSSR
jgi:hypothetical protein